MHPRILLFATTASLLALAGCAEPEEATPGGGEIECDDENNVDIGAPDETTNVGGVECEEVEVDSGNA